MASKLIEKKKYRLVMLKVVGLGNASSVANKIIEELSVRQTEKFVKIFKTKSKANILLKDSNIQNLEDNITSKIGLRVEIKNKRNNQGKIIFEYKNLEQLDKIIETIKNNY